MPKISKEQPDYEGAAKRIGKQATLRRGAISAQVSVLATRTAYGRLEYLIQSGEAREWVRERSLEFAL